MRGAKILVVDDEPALLEVLTRYLDAVGHRVTGAASAEAALEALSAGSQDFVLLDQVLPGLTGMQALAKMKRLTRAPIYLMSGQSDDETRKDAMLLGAAGFFGKPLDLPAIVAVIDALAPDRA